MPSFANGSMALAESACAPLIDPLPRPATDVGLHNGQPILVATDGDRACGAALRVAAALAAQDGRAIEAIFIEGTLPSVSGVCIGADALRFEPIPESTRLGRVRRQLCSILDGASWKLHVEFGRIGPTIAGVARTGQASLIVMGLSQEGLARRLLGSGAIARVLQSAQVPVLAVTATARELPSAAVAAIDFSPASLRAAREACELLVRPGMLQLVHVRPAMTEPVAEQASRDAIYEAGVKIKLAQLARELSADGVTVVPRIESGALVDSLVRVAREVNAAVIACGARNQNPIERHLLGQTPLHLMLGGECSILIAPALSLGSTPTESQ